MRRIRIQTASTGLRFGRTARRVPQPRLQSSLAHLSTSVRGHRALNARTRPTSNGPLAAAGCVAVLALSACGSSSGGPTVSASSAPGANVAAAQALLAANEALPTFTAPGPAFDASKAAGKLLYNIPASSSNLPIELTDGTLATISRQLGVKFVEYTNQGQTSQWIQGFNQAISQHANVIMMEGINPSQVAPEVLAAENAGIKVIPLHIGQQGYNFQPTVATAVPGPFQLAGQEEAAAAIVGTKGQGDTLFISSNDFVPASQETVSAIQAYMSTNCPGCHATYANVPSSDWATRVQSTVAAALTADPNLKYVVPVFDGMVQYAVAAVTAAGKVGSVGIGSYNGSPSVLSYIAQGSVTMDGGENDTWLAYADMDQALRVLTGTSPVVTESTPIRVFVKSNISDAGSPPAIDVGYGNAYLAGYDALWGLHS